MRSDQLNAAIEAAEKLSFKNQEMIAKEILKRIKDMEWEETLTSPESLADSERMRAKIESDIASGNSKNYLTDSDEDLAKLF
jgi:hypothetical protein